MIHKIKVAITLVIFLYTITLALKGWYLMIRDTIFALKDLRRNKA